LSHAALAGRGVITQGYRLDSPAISTRNSPNETGMNATVVVAIRRRRAAHFASVSSNMPAIAGPDAASPDQKSRFTRNTAHTRAPPPAKRPPPKASAPMSTRSARMAGAREGPPAGG